MPSIPNPSYTNSKDPQYKAPQKIKEDVSITHSQPYPQEFNLPKASNESEIIDFS
ncbi:hypothetical protein ACMDB5_01525 [Flavobacterium sp. W1B]|uniref:hypothetical protein n=1 Tax=Flavobacterium sp. W1B TaxID=3394146 RepID=UPI0039BC34AE